MKKAFKVNDVETEQEVVNEIMPMDVQVKENNKFLTKMKNLYEKIKQFSKKATLKNVDLSEKPVLRNWVVFAICLFGVACMLNICSSNSNLYFFNYWCDQNWYLTLGLAMVQRGAVPYKDVFDHKGPITYFVFAFCNLFPDPYLAAWFVELFCFSICAYILTQIAMRYLKNRPLSITCALVTICILLVAPHYGAGGVLLRNIFCQ